MAEFKLEDVVEQSVKRSNGLTGMTDHLRSSLDLDAQERARMALASGVNAIAPSPEAENYALVKAEKNAALAELTEQVKPVYKEAKGLYVDGLSAEMQSQHYYQVLREVVINGQLDFGKLSKAVKDAKEAKDEEGTKKAETLLKTAALVKETEDLQDRVNSANATGRMGELADYMRHQYGNDVDSLLVVNSYIARGATHAMTELATKVVNAKRAKVIGELKKNKLYGWVEGMVGEKDMHGYAIQNAYALYNSKPETDYRKKKAEDAAKAAK